MNAPARFDEAHAASSDLHVRLLASAILNGQFDGVDLDYYSKVDWVGAAQCLADSDDTSEMSWMLAKSDFYVNRWRNLHETTQDKWGDFETWFDAQTSRRFAA